MTELLKKACCCGPDIPPPVDCYVIGNLCGCSDSLDPQVAIHCEGILSEDAQFVAGAFGACYEVDATVTFPDPQGLPILPDWVEYENCEDCCPDCYQEFSRCGPGEPNNFCVLLDDCNTLALPNGTIVVKDGVCWVAGGLALPKFCGEILGQGDVGASGYATCQACIDDLETNECPGNCDGCLFFMDLTIGTSVIQTDSNSCLGNAGTNVNIASTVLEMQRAGCGWFDTCDGGTCFEGPFDCNFGFTYFVSYSAEVGCSGFIEDGELVFRWYIDVTIGTSVGSADGFAKYKGALATPNSCPAGPWILVQNNGFISPPTVGLGP
jgi:hypothetical protein